MLALALAMAVAAPEIAAAAPDVAAARIPAGTAVRLMIVREVNSRTAKPGDRFKLRLDQPVSVGGATLAATGAPAWGEIVEVKGNGAAGKSGRLSARLLYLDLPSGQVPLRGEHEDRGKGNTTGVVLAVIGFGLLGLLNSGDSGRLKAGDILTGYVAD